MALQPRLDLRQAQALVMTPQMQQAVKLLQLSNLELNEWVEGELESNPLLERAGTDTDLAAEHDDAVAPELASRGEDDSLLDQREGSPEVPLDVDINDRFDDGSYEYASRDLRLSDRGVMSDGGGQRDAFADDDIDTDQAMPLSLRDHVLRQIDFDFSEPKDRFIAAALVDYLDDNGWLATPITDLAAVLNIPEAALDTILCRLQRLDPPGVFARSLRECLALQLEDRNRLDPAMSALLENLDLLARCDFAALSALCGVDREDMAEMVDEIRALDPRPGQKFSDTVSAPVIPDILMHPLPGGGWGVELNPDTLPRVLVNTRYYAHVKGAVHSKEERDFIRDHFQTATWLVRALDQRAETILKVSSEIVRRQYQFFKNGVAYLRPLVLKDIAEAIDMHESTISRVTSHKYMATPLGVYELKYFFTTGIRTLDGTDSLSAESVRSRIRALVEAEQPSCILSDDAIVECLRAEGIALARRTVSKYRESMKIPSSVQRKRAKNR